MGHDFLPPLNSWDSREQGASTGPRLVVVAGLACFALLLVAFMSRDHASATALSRTGYSENGLSGFTPTQAAAGRQLFVVHCSSCHGSNARGTRDGPTLIDAGAAAADFYLRTGRMPLNDPHQQPVREAPAFPPDQIADLDAYVASLDSGPAIPTVLPGNLASGNELFAINCAQCHNIAGAGGALGYGDIVPSLRHATALDVVEAARIGPAPMPVFGPQSLATSRSRTWPPMSSTSITLRTGAASGSVTSVPSPRASLAGWWAWGRCSSSLD